MPKRTRATLTVAASLLTLVSPALAACSASTESPATTTPAASAAVVRHVDLAYAEASASQMLDIYLPGTDSGPYPVILAIHGGGFLVGDKADRQLTPMLSGLARGYAVVSLNYRLSNEAPFPAQINDVKAAIRWLRAKAASYQLDPNRIAVWGSSAGGNLAALAGTSGGVAALSDPVQGNAAQPDVVQAVVDWFGPIAFLQMDPDLQASGAGPAQHDAAGSNLSQYMGAALPTVPARVKAADPTTYVTADDPAFFIEHGTADGTVPVQQSQRFAATLAETLGTSDVTLELLPGSGHAGPAFMTSANVDLVLDWLDAQLK